MRKRAQRRFGLIPEEQRSYVPQTVEVVEKKHFKINKNLWVPLLLICIFCLTLFFNTYFNLTSGVSLDPEGEGIDKYYLSGPDPYYNQRIVKGILEDGKYPYYIEHDRLLNYPLGVSGDRPPLLNMMAVGFSRLLTPFMPEVDAVGYSMQFIPALFGALIIFVIYFIGAELFNKKVGLIAAIFMAIIPIHLGSGHGSAFSLFDHDSLNLLLFFFTFLFLIKSLKEKDQIKSILYAFLGGISLAGLSLVWVEAQFLFVVIAIYAIVQMLFDIFTNKIEFKVMSTSSVILFSGYFISLPVIASKTGINMSIQLFLAIAVTAFGIIYYLFNRKKIPWTISLPSIFILGIIGLIFLYFIVPISNAIKFLSPLNKLSVVIFGEGIYGNKVSMTIAEANTSSISQTIMSFGPTIYWLAWGGFILLMWYYYREKLRKEYLFILIIFIVDVYLSFTAGRFLNDMVPLIALLGAWVVWFFVDWLDFNEMIRNIRGAGGGFHGIRKGMKFIHIFGILFIAFIVILPNAFIAFDAAVPTAFTKEYNSTLKRDIFGSDSGAFGMGVGKERYWADAFRWLSEQDKYDENNNSILDENKPAFISWWDYGFYEVALGGHPTVADNFQDGIPPAANFHTATSEREAVVVWIARLLEGVMDRNGKITEDVIEILNKYMDVNDTNKIVGWIESPSSAPSFGDPIGAEFDENKSKEYTVGQQYSMNAAIHNITDLLANSNVSISLSDEQITWLYHDLQEATGWSIRYYGVEGYDKQIFNIFGFLSDKSILLVSGTGDIFSDLYYSGYKLKANGEEDLSQPFELLAKDILEMDTITMQKTYSIRRSSQKFKYPYFETMFYKTYIGPSQDPEDNSIYKEEYKYQIPCLGMKHFYAEYMSDLAKYPYYGTRMASVVIAKYYEGAIINGTITYKGEPVDAKLVALKNLTFYNDVSYGIDHDSTFTDNKGNFSLILGAGAYLQIQKSVGEGSFILENITFSGLEGTPYATITDADASRKSGSNFERFLNITIQPGSLSGIVYEDVDDNSKYNSSKDEPIDDATVYIYEITSVTQSNFFSSPEVGNFTTDETGYYNFSDLDPGYYFIKVQKDGFNIIETTLSVNQGNNTNNLKKMKPGSVEGTVTLNDDYGTKQESENANVDLVYTRTDLSGTNVEEYKYIDSTKTDENGFYSFDKTQVPGSYLINVTSSEGYYFTSQKVTISENKTISQNITLTLIPVSVSGTAKYNNVGINGIPVNFTKNESRLVNTAVNKTVTTTANGAYTAEIIPGYYNVTVDYKEGDIQVYSFTGSVDLDKGVDSKLFNIALEKKSTTVSGKASYLGNTSLGGINIKFEPDLSETSNSAKFSRTIKANATTGAYTVELSAGIYNITVNEKVTINGKNYTYTYPNEKITISATPTTIPRDILLTRTERD